MESAKILFFRYVSINNFVFIKLMCKNHRYTEKCNFASL